MPLLLALYYELHYGDSQAHSHNKLKCHWDIILYSKGYYNAV